MSARPRLGACVLVRDASGDRVLLGTRRSTGQLVVPGGGVEMFEPVAAAAVRELREETGLDVALDLPVRWTVHELMTDAEHRVCLLATGTADGEPRPTKSDLASPRWYRREELPGLALSPACRRMLSERGWLP